MSIKKFQLVEEDIFYYRIGGAFEMLEDAVAKRKIRFDARKLMGMQPSVARNVPKKAMASVCAKPVKITEKYQVEKSCHKNIAANIGFMLTNPPRILVREKPKK